MPIRVAPSKSSTEGVLVYGLPPPPPGYPQKRAGLSLCMIVKNEEKFLERCLRSLVDVVDEINIIDTGSTDSTVEIARRFGANIDFREWRSDFAWARNEVLAMATYRWIMVQDADEELDPECIMMLHALKNAPAHKVGAYIRCLNLSNSVEEVDLLANAMAHSIIRIFPNDPTIRYTGAIHEHLIGTETGLGIEAVNTPVRIWHHGYTNETIAAKNKFDRNLSIVEEETKSDPDEAFNWYNLGQTRLVRGDTEAGIEALERMWEINGDTPRGYFPTGLSCLAEAYSARLNKNERALEICEFLTEFAPRYSNGHFIHGQVLIRLDRVEEGREALERAVEAGVHNEKQMVVDSEIAEWKAFNELGVSYIPEKNYEKALEWFDRGLESRGDAWQLRLNRARALEMLERYSEAEEAYATGHESGAVEALTGEYVNFLLRRNRFNRALEVIRDAAGVVSPDFAVALLVTGAVVAERLGLGGAEVYLNRALEVSPGSGYTFSAIDALAKQRGEGGDLQVRKLLERELESSPRSVVDYIRRSHVLLESKDWEGALRAARDGLALAGQQPMLLFNAAMACLQIGQTAEADVLLAQIDVSDPEVSLTARYLRALLMEQSGRTAEAIEMLDEVLDLDPAHPDALFLKAQLQERLEDTAGAEVTLFAAQERGGMRAGRELASFYLRQGRYAEAANAADLALAHG